MLVGVVILIVVGGFFYWMPTIWGIETNLPPQQNDSTFHLSAVMSKVQSGDASPLTAFSSLYGLSEVQVAYPAVWHQLAALFATQSTVVQVSRALQLTIALIWLINIAVTTSIALPRLWGGKLLALAIAQAVPVFPVYYHVVIPLWPNALGVAILPGLFAGVVIVFRNFKYLGRSFCIKLGLLAQVIWLILGMMGLTVVYPPAVFSLVFLILGGAQ